MRSFSGTARKAVWELITTLGRVQSGLSVGSGSGSKTSGTVPANRPSIRMIARI